MASDRRQPEQIRDADAFEAPYRARIYLRRNIGPQSIAQIKSRLEGAGDRVRFTPFFSWTTIEFADEEDFRSVRSSFKHLIDGWELADRDAQA